MEEGKEFKEDNLDEKERENVKMNKKIDCKLKNKKSNDACKKKTQKPCERRERVEFYVKKKGSKKRKKVSFLARRC